MSSAKGVRKLIQVEQAWLLRCRGLNRNKCHFEAAARQPIERIKDGRVLARDTDEMAPLVGQSIGEAADGQVVTLRGAARENDLSRFGVQTAGNGCTCCFNRIPGGPPKGMAGAPGVPILLRKVRQHRVDHSWIDACC